jgi:hypothetical protein
MLIKDTARQERQRAMPVIEISRYAEGGERPVDVTRSTLSRRGSQRRAISPVIASAVVWTGSAAVVAETDALRTHDVQWLRELS